MPTLLVVDDEPNVRYSLERSLQSDTLQVITASTARQGIDLVRQRQPDAMLLDVRLPDISGLDAFQQIRELDPRLPVIIMTAHASTETAIEATKRGAFDYLLKPVDLRQLQDLVAQALELRRLSNVPAVFDEEEPEAADTRADRIVGRSPAMQEVYKAIGRVAPSDVSVLILGESGTGKELVARAVYQHSRRSDGPFLAVNCAAIPETLLESELFGHERGSFTGAERRRVGKFEQADGGTIFLDEIGDMSLASQAKILRVMQDQRFERVGGNETIQTNVRVIAATNQDMEKLVADGRFRLDLYHRLKVYTIALPPLRQRRDDLPLLLEYYLRLYNHDLDKRVRAVSPEAMRLLENHRWPGNIREFQSAVIYAMVNAGTDVLTPHCFPDSVQAAVPGATRPGAPDDPRLDIARLVRTLVESGEDDIQRKVQMAVDRAMFEEVMRHVHGNQVEASRLLGISRTTLRSKLASLGLVFEKQLLPESD